MILWKEWRGVIGNWDARGAGIGGWTLNVHHRYDPQERKLYFGDGTVQSVTGSVFTASVTVAAGGGLTPPNDGDGGPAVNARLKAPERLAIDPDGALIIADTGHDRLRR